MLLAGGSAPAGQGAHQIGPLDAKFANAPASARVRKNPYAGQLQAVLAGKKLYRRHCAECHGDTGSAEPRGPSLRSPRIQTAPPGVLVWFLRNGKLEKGMPSWSRLPDQRLWQIVAYLQAEN